MNYLLRILANVAYEYTGAQLEAGDFSISEELTADGVDVADVEISLDGTFLGASDRFSLQPDNGIGWRAELSDADTGTVLADGIIYRKQVVHEPLESRWVLTIVQAAGAQFLERLAATQIVSADPYVVTSTTVPESGAEQIVTLAWHPMRRLLDRVITNAGNIELIYPTPEVDSFPLEVRYLDGITEKTIRRAAMHTVCLCSPAGEGVAAGLPAWTGRQLFDVMQAMCAWRIVSRYGPWPSRQIVVELLSDRWMEPSGPELDLLVDEGGYEIREEEPEEVDFALAFANDIGAPSLFASSTAPLKAAVYAAVKEVVKDDRPVNTGLSEIDLHVPDVMGVELVQNVTPDPTGHPAYQENVAVGNPVVAATGKVYVAAIDLVDGARRMVVRRTPVSPAPSQDADVHECWASTLFGNHQVIRAGSYVAEGTFDVLGLTPLPIVGKPSFGAQLMAKGWVLKSQETSFEMGAATYQLMRVEDLEPLPPGVPPVGMPEDLTVTRTEVDGDWRYSVQWTAPQALPGLEPVVGYDLEWNIENGAWQSLVSGTPATAFTHTIPYVSPVPWTWHRVRARGEFGGLSQWVYKSP